MKVIDLFMQHFDWSCSDSEAIEKLAGYLGVDTGPCPKIITDFRLCCRDCKLCWKQYLESEV